MRLSFPITALAAICAILCQGCVTMKDLYQHGVASVRKPGQHQVHSAEATLKKRCCPPYQLNVLYLEEAGAIPERISPGEEVDHRIRYAFCPAVRTEVLRARLTRKVLFRGKEVFRDVSNQTFCAGTWDIEAFIRVPQSAPPGLYIIKVEISSPGKTIRRSSTFFVKAKRLRKPTAAHATGSASTIQRD